MVTEERRRKRAETQVEAGGKGGREGEGESARDKRAQTGRSEKGRGREGGSED